ncbi:MAG TPA: ABC transporter substrate-binding protein [Chloroflexota bacterium]|nr:ABC transporter substrate-binding protein [Chloroflexota bacterium]
MSAKPGVSAAAAASGNPIKIGVIGEYTGPFGVNGNRIADTLDWLLQQDGGQIAGRPVKLIRAEDQAKVDVFQSEAKRLMETEKVDLFIGPINSGVAASAQKWMNDQPTTWVIYEVGTVQYYPGDNAVRSVATSWHHALPALGQYYADQGIKRAVTIGLDYAAGRDFVNGEVKDVLPAGKIELAKQFWVPVGNADFGPIISQIPSGQDVMITGALWAADALRFMQQATDFGLKSKVKVIAFPAAFANDDDDPTALAAGAGMYVYNEMPPPDLPNPDYQKFVAAYKQKFGVNPGYATKAYLSYLQVKQAAEALKGDLSDRKKLIEELRQPVKTPFGTVQFDKCGNAVRSIFFKQIKSVDGKGETSLVKEFGDSSIPCPQPAEWKG